MSDRTPPADAPDLDNLTARREVNALAIWRSEGKAPSGVCPHCGSTVSVVQRDERYVARCSHRGCGARGPQHFRLTSAVEAFCRPPADAPLPYGITTRGFVVSGDRTREPLAEVIHDAACSYLVTAANALPALLADHARLTAEVARLRGLVDLITNLITNPAPIEHGLVMDEPEPRRTSPIGRMIERVLPIDEDADRRVTAALSRAARTARESRNLHPAPSIRTLAATLARNLRDAAGCALAYDLGCSAEHARMPWDANLAGRPAPGWER